ncbi:hypothetical protein MUP77_13185 [Candidatus Bathyarchaeota archaeon]|nr:hypothetical protein [Candidatus Bathyarchaeota archaeon]
MRLVSYCFLAVVLVVVCVVYVQFSWQDSTMTSGFTGSGTFSFSQNETNGQSIGTQTSASTSVSRLGLPVYDGAGGYVWPTHMLFFCLLWCGLLMFAFVDALKIE